MKNSKDPQPDPDPLGQLITGTGSTGSENSEDPEPDLYSWGQLMTDPPYPEPQHSFYILVNLG